MLKLCVPMNNGPRASSQCCKPVSLQFSLSCLLSSRQAAAVVWCCAEGPGLRCVCCDTQGLVQAGGVAASVFHARFALFEVLQRLNGGRPTGALLLGCLLLGAGIGCMPLVLLQHSQSHLARRALVLTAALGTLLVMLRPPLPIQVWLSGRFALSHVLHQYAITACACQWQGKRPARLAL